MVKMPNVMRTAFTQFEEAVARLTARNGIRAPLNIEITPTPVVATSPAAYQQIPGLPPKILITEQLARQGDSIIAMGATAHEIGHALADHSVGIGFGGILIDMKNPFVPDFSPAFKEPGFLGKIKWVPAAYRVISAFNQDQKRLIGVYKGQEHEADQLMTHLLGSQGDALTVRRTMTLGSELAPYAEIPLLHSTTVLGRMLSPVSHALQRNAMRKLYGTAEELEANIRRVNLSDRSHVERLIERWNNQAELTR